MHEGFRPESDVDRFYVVKGGRGLVTFKERSLQNNVRRSDEKISKVFEVQERR